MSSTLQPSTTDNKLNLDIASGTHAPLHHVTEDPVEHSKLASLHATAIREAVFEGAHHHEHLHHIQPPKEGISPAVKETYLAEHGKKVPAAAGDCCGKCDCGTACKCSDKCRTGEKL